MAPMKDQEDAKKTEYTVDEIKKIAYIGSELPPASLPPPDRILWYSFRDLYSRFKQKKITKEQSQAEAENIIKTYEDDRKLYNDVDDVWKYHGRFWSAIELAGSRYALERTIEAANEFYTAVYGTKLGELRTFKRSED